MPTGAITEYINVAQVALYVFWFAFAALIYYLHRENKREGYPLESDRSPYITVQGYPAAPGPKEYLEKDGSKNIIANGNPDTREIHAKPVANYPGAPLEPTGNPMVDGVGPASWANRADIPDVTMDGVPRIVPMRIAGHGFAVSSNDPDPRGMKVVALDGKVAGECLDIWVDRSEAMPRYLEVKLADGGIRLVPMFLTKIARSEYGPAKGTPKERSEDYRERFVRVVSVKAEHFAEAPTVKDPESITRLEEDKIMAYFGGGHFYATPQRKYKFL
ncbi:photosynthetic reaction center H subunit [Ectothiorhodosinus mongolicus]|uniref:Photosynthetic reaction center H subunit n=1 Tax=Ectothiorhodosinus mongolicus TaxID=233100 RepID=A0A1R3VLY0_9GAMM|nr:photosynthetic reaction center subunit H [Ectothiorhodosinus mongolicus]ULX57713.1 photosynthetic reaction center subunit H [Ectothiorhodosinus mongolicus]SIT65567.1 photosynthetic reaction center H subunit [Ectothiorhodosinus mongolicus]